MGCGPQKPNRQSIEDHSNLNNDKNDQQFYDCLEYNLQLPERQIPEEVSSAEQISTRITQATTQQNFFQSLKVNIQQKIQNARNSLQRAKDDNPQQPQKQSRLLIEIRKAKHIPNTAGCSKSRPFIKLRSNPKLLEYRTEESEPFIPQWFQLFELQGQRNEINKIQIQLFNQDLGHEIFLGEFILDPKEQDGEIIQKWYQARIAPSADANQTEYMELEIKYQPQFKLVECLENHMQKLIQTEKLVQEKIEKCQNFLNKYKTQ